MADTNENQEVINLLEYLNQTVGFERVKANWLIVLIFTFFPILGFSIIAGFFAGKTGFFQCFLGTSFLALGLLIFSVLIMFLNEHYAGANKKRAELDKALADFDSVFVPFEETIKEFESRLTELMAVLPKEAAINYQKSKALWSALLKRKETIINFRDNEGPEGVEAGLEVLLLPIEIKMDTVNSITQVSMPRKIDAKDWVKSIEELHNELKKYLSRQAK